MSHDYFDEVIDGDEMDAASVNGPMGQLDAKIGELVALVASGAGYATTLDAQAASGQKVIPVVSTVGAVAGQSLYLGPTNGNYEVVTIDTIQAGVSITAVANLTYTHEIGEPLSASPAEVVEARAGSTNLGIRLRSTAGIAASSFPGGPVDGQVCIRSDRAGARYRYDGADFAWKQIGVPNVTAFWGTPSTNDRAYRTDLRDAFTYNGTRWVSDPKLMTFGAGDNALPLSADGLPFRLDGFDLADGATDVWLDEVVLRMRVATTNDGTKYWTVTANKRIANNTATSLGSTLTQGMAADTWYGYGITIAALLGGNTYLVIDLSAAKTSTPGNLQATAHLKYRRVAT